ncbi:o-succinylbenzoate synthase [Caenibacillus caldisaponilyticus]|uniref:o-succinylbenzoate synthase n=1 Tax=Caenibacillus caldisaponilyticus TaxID=1674942 RepID=UPI0009885A49|nr:o-succinylbenzoate synthase [Caenibacillus caldisaponilyticus]
MGAETFAIQKIVMRKLRMRLKHPFSTSFGTVQDKHFFIIEIVDRDGIKGYGESVAFDTPWYTEETVGTVAHVIEDFLIPLLKGAVLRHPDDVTDLFRPIRRNNMAKAAVEGAIWDVYAKRKGVSLAGALGGKKKTIDVGISIGLQKDMNALLEVIRKALADGYKRIKIKIKPGRDIDLIDNVRREFPDVPLMADANSAYTLKDADRLKALDAYGLLMIEQPLGHDDIVDHARLQQHIDTPICLDESIHSFDDARHAIELGSCRIINIKIGRVGGLTAAKRIHDYCRSRDVPVWCGGMLEAGIGRAHNIALSSLEGFTLPGDTSGSNRYWHRDIIVPEVVAENGTIRVPDGAGIGYAVDEEALEAFTVAKKEFVF